MKLRATNKDAAEPESEQSVLESYKEDSTSSKPLIVAKLKNKIQKLKKELEVKKQKKKAAIQKLEKEKETQIQKLEKEKETQIEKLEKREKEKDNKIQMLENYMKGFYDDLFNYAMKQQGETQENLFSLLKKYH